MAKVELVEKLWSTDIKERFQDCLCSVYDHNRVAESRVRNLIELSSKKLSVIINLFIEKRRNQTHHPKPQK